jgi:hypothetical protein
MRLGLEIGRRLGEDSAWKIEIRSMSDSVPPGKLGAAGRSGGPQAVPAAGREAHNR